MNKSKNDKSSVADKISQDELDTLLGDLIADDDIAHKSLIDEIQEAILDSAKLSLNEWKTLRGKLIEIEELVPHIDLIIKLKDKKKDRRRG